MLLRPGRPVSRGATAQAAATATGWRVRNGLPLQQRWGIRELRLFRDEACSDEILGGPRLLPHRGYRGAAGYVFSSGAELSFGLDEACGLDLIGIAP